MARLLFDDLMQTNAALIYRPAGRVAGACCSWGSRWHYVLQPLVCLPHPPRLRSSRSTPMAAFMPRWCKIAPSRKCQLRPERGWTASRWSRPWSPLTSWSITPPSWSSTVKACEQRKPGPGRPREAQRPWLVAFRQSGIPSTFIPKDSCSMGDYSCRQCGKTNAVAGFPSNR